MRLLKRRPTIQLLAPPEVEVGAPFHVRVILECPAELRVDQVLVELLGLEVWLGETQYGRHRNEAAFCRAVTRPASQVELTEGRHIYAATFQIPERFPGSFTGQRLRIEYVVNVHVDIPWWPSARASFLVNVRGPEEPPPPEQQTVYVSDAGGPPARKPYAELSLSSTLVEAGGQLRGALALANVELNEYRGVDLSIVAVEQVPAPLGELVYHTRLAQWRIDLTTPRESESLHFALRLPEQLRPGFRTRHLALQWFLVAKVDVAWEVDPELWIPLRIRPPGCETEDELEPAPPAVGSERTELVWRSVARRLGYEYFEGSLSRSAGRCQVDIRREHRGLEGLYLMAEIRFPDLGIGLGLERRVGDRMVLTSRDHEQTAFLRRHLDDVLEACRPFRADDQHIICQVADSGSRSSSLEMFARRVWELASTLEEIRQDIPAPRALHVQVDDWVRAAREIGGTFQRSSMHIHVTREQMPCSLFIQWTALGQPEFLVVEVKPLTPLASRHHFRWRANGTNLPPRMFMHLAPLCRGSEGMIIDRENLRVFLPALTTPMHEALTRLDGLIALAKRLSGSTGPYR